MIVIYNNKEWLEQKYLNERLSSHKIAKLCGVTSNTILRNMSKLEIMRRPRIMALKGVKRTKEARQNISKHHADVCGKNNPMFGKIHSKATKEKMSFARKEWMKKNDHPALGTHCSEERKIKSGLSRKGKTYEEFYGAERGKSHREKHFKAQRRGKDSATWQGGRFYENGYICVYAPSHPFNRKGYVFEHRLMAEKVLGRFLKGQERVHHINEDKSDNRNENFVICSLSYHSWLHRKIDQTKIGELK